MDDYSFHALCAAVCRSKSSYGSYLDFPTKPQLWQLLTAAGFDTSIEPDIVHREPKTDWIARHLESDRTSSVIMAGFILVSADTRRFLGNGQAHVAFINRLNDVLSFNGLGVEIASGLPRFVEVEYSYRPFGSKNVEDSFEYINTSELLQSPVWSSAVELRFKEAGRCRSNKAYLAGIVMLGSALETLLLGVLLENPKGRQAATKAPRDSEGKIASIFDWNLRSLIEVAHELRWIDRDARDFSQLLRDYRNLVHGGHQVSKNPAPPNQHTCQICWTVAEAAVSDIREQLGVMTKESF